MKPLSDCRLYAFVDTAYLRGRTVETVAQQLCDGGSDLIQLRAKKSSAGEIRAMAAKIIPITRRAGVGLVINDHPSISVEVGADFCHLGQEDFFDANPKLQVQNLKIKIGLSTHSPGQAMRALVARPAYIAIGPVFATGTKPGAKPVTLEYVRWAAANVTIPWFAIGGIDAQNLHEVLAAGAKRVCVVSALLNGPDITEACREFRRILG